MPFEPSSLDPSWLERLPGELRPWLDIARPGLVSYAPRVTVAMIKWVFHRFRHDPPEVQKKALDYGSDMTQQFTSRVDELITSGRITEEQVRARFQDPDFVKALEDRLLEACETPDAFLHDEVASLMAEMLTAPAQSRRAVMLRRAAASLREINGRQAKILGLAYALYHVGPKYEDALAYRDAPERLREYVSDVVAPALRPFDDVALDYVDIDHLEGLGLVTVIDRHFSQSRSLLLFPIDLAAWSLPDDVRTLPGLVRAQQLMVGNIADNRLGFESARLTAVGFILGLCAYKIARNEVFELEPWSDDPVSGTLAT
jgi:hypothetical protein